MLEPEADTRPGIESRDAIDDSRDTSEGSDSGLITRLARRGMRLALWLGVAAPVAFGLLLLALQNDWVTRRALSAGVGAALGAGSSLSVTDIGGNRLTGLTAVGVRLAGPGDALRFQADTLRVRYFPLSLLWGKLSLRELRIVAPALEIRRSLPDSTPQPGPREDGNGGLAVAIRDLQIRRGSLTLIGPPSSPPDTLQVRDLHVRVDGLRFGDGLALRVDTLGLRFHTTSHTAGWANLAARGRLSRDSLVVGALALSSPYSSLQASGTLPLPPSGAPLSGIDSKVANFSLVASPLGFRDLRPIVAGIDPDADAQLDLNVRGSESTLDARVTARVSDGSELRFTGSWTAGAEGGYRVDGRIRDLDPGLWIAGGEDLGSLNAELEADLRGSKLSTASGPANLVLTDSRYAGLEVSRAEAEVRLDEGRVELELEADLSTGPLSASGWLRPFEAEITYDLQGQGTLEVERLPRGADLRKFIGDLRAEWSLVGKGVDPASAGAEARVELRSLGGDVGHLEMGRLEAELADGEGVVRGELTTTGGPVRLEGKFRLGEPIEYELGRLEFDDLSLAAFLDDSVSGRVTGRLSGRGSGTDPRRADIRARLRFAEASYAGYAVDTLDLSARLRRGELGLEGWAGVGPGRIEVVAMAAPFEDRARYRVRELRVRSLDIGRLTGLAAETDINADGRLSFGGSQLEAELDLRPSRVNAQRIDSGFISFEMEDGDLEGGVELAGPEGSLSFNVEGKPLADRPTYSITNGRFRHIDLGALLDRSRLASDLNGSFQLDGAGRGLADVTLTAEVVVDTSRVDTLTLTGGRFVSEAEGGRFQLEASLAADRGALLDTLSASLRFGSGVLELDTLIARSSFARVDAGGRIAGLDEPARDSTDLQARVELIDLNALATLAGLGGPAVGRGEVDFAATGRMDALRIRLQGEASNLDLGFVQISRITADANARLDERRRLASASGSARIEQMLLGPTPVSDTRVEASYDDSEIRVELESRDVRRDLRLTAVVDPRPESQRVRIEEFDLRLDQRHWVLEREATVRYGEPLEVEDFELRSGSRRFVAGGSLSRRDSSDFSLAVDSLRLGAIADAVGFRQVDGSLSLTARLVGPAGAPRAEGQLAASIDSRAGPVARVSADAGWSGGALALDANVTHSSGKVLKIDGQLPFSLDLTAAADSIVEDGVVAYSDRGLNLNLRADAFPIDVVRPFLDPQFATDLRGRLDADVTLRGTAQSPELGGDLRLSDAGVRLPGLGVSYDPIEVVLGFQGDRLRIDRATVRSGDGSARLSGEVNVRHLNLGDFDITSSFDRFQAIASTDYSAAVSGELRLTGTTSVPSLGGRITVEEANVYLSASDLPASVEPVELTEEDYEMLQDYWGYGIERRRPPFLRAFYDAAGIDLRLVITRNTWIRHRSTPAVAVEVSGELQIRKESQGELRLFGSVSPVTNRSYVEQFGRRFQITDGDVTFRGEPGSVTYRLTAEYSVPATGSRNTGDIVITLEIRGDTENLSLTLGSRPPLEEADIVSYLATGQPATGGGFGFTGESAAQTALAPVTGELEELASREIGLDVVEIRQDGFSGATLVAGRYVTPQLYLGFKQPVSFRQGSTDAPGVANQTEFVLEYEVYRWLLLNFEGGAAQGRLLLRARHAY